jgi:hypothetical protein
MAEAAAGLLGQRGLLSPLSPGPASDHLTSRFICFVTDEARVSEVGARFLGRALDDVKLVEL